MKRISLSLSRVIRKKNHDEKNGLVCLVINRRTDFPPKPFPDLFVTNNQICRLKGTSMNDVGGKGVTHPLIEPVLTLHFPPPDHAVYRLGANYLRAIKHLSPDNQHC